MRKHSTLQYIGAILIVLMLGTKSAKAQQSFYINGHCGSKQFGQNDSVHVGNKNQTVWFDVDPVDTANFFNSQVMEHIYTDENGVRVNETIAQGEGQWLWHTSSYAGKYRVRAFHNGSKAFEIVFYIRKSY